MSDALEAKVRHAPRSPGVYLMKDGEGGVLYVGKARDLRARIRAYFLKTDGRAMIPFLVSRIRDIEFIVTGTEKEALILENTLIKEHRPRYNVLFKDDKSYVHLRIDPAEPFPRFQLVRRPKPDKARHFGPYPSAGAARETLRFLQTIFPLRNCRDAELTGRRRPCLEYEIGRCTAPCVGRIDPEAYGLLVRDGIAFLEGKERTLVAELHSRMAEAAEALRFEEAAALRDRIAAIEQTLEKQRIFSLTGADRDFFGLYREGEGAFTQVAVLHLRGGRVIGQKTFPPIQLRASTPELLSALLQRHYDSGAEIPGEIVLPEMPEDGDVIAEWLTEKRGKKVAIVVPRRGETMALLKIAGRNAETAFQTARRAVENPKAALPLLAEKLKLTRLPRRIACVDISHLGGKYGVGSLVAFSDGLPDKAGYRRFRIRTVPGADDFAMMYEVLKRHFEKGEGFPDLLVVDGGKGQLAVALAVLKDLHCDGVEAIALAKERDDPESTAQTPGRSEDRVFLPGRKDPVYLSRWPAALFLLQRIRDEAHRFAVSYQRRLKEKEDLRSLLDRIPGVGAARRTALLSFFGDLKRIRSATVTELSQAEGIGQETAERIRAFLDGSAKKTG